MTAPSLTAETVDIYALLADITRECAVALYADLRALDPAGPAVADGRQIAVWGRSPGRVMDAVQVVADHLTATRSITADAAQRIFDSLLTIGGFQVFGCDGSGGAWYSDTSRPPWHPDTIILRCPYRLPSSARALHTQITTMLEDDAA